jgi:hypothetical protein
MSNSPQVQKPQDQKSDYSNHSNAGKVGNNIHKDASNAHKKTGDMKDDAFSEATNGFKRATTECMDICSGNLNVYAESGSKVSQIFQNISSEFIESCNRNFSDMAELSQQALACRTLKDVIELRSRSVQQVCNSYFNATNKLSGLLFDSCSEVLDSLNERTAMASKQLRKAMAA